MQELTKQQARILIREKLSDMTDSMRAEKSDIICDKIIASNILDNAQKILLYKSLPKEVNVDKLIKYCIDKGKNVFLPRVNGDIMEMVAYDNQLKIGAYGIYEPIGKPTDEIVDVAIIPLLGIDFALNRLGKGKGYYDKFLNNTKAYKVAVAYAQQILQNIPTDERDIKMDICFTDNNIITI